MSRSDEPQYDAGDLFFALALAVFVVIPALLLWVFLVKEIWHAITGAC